MSKILIIEDEPKLREELKQFLSNNGYEVYMITDFNNVTKYIKDNIFDLILLDINIPVLNGQIVCKEVRTFSSVPIIIVTSRNTVVDEIISINYGADDFITKPYNTQILLARIERLIKRSQDNSNLIKYKDLLIDTNKSMLSKDNNIIDLTKNEARILVCLLNNRGKIISRDTIMEYLWSDDEFVDDNTLTVNINRLRNKLSLVGYPELIVTKRSQGYIIL